VGANAQRIALERLGHQAWLVPTIQLSSHPGHAAFSGNVTPPDALASMIQAIGNNGWLADLAAVLTGYMPSAEHAAIAAGAVNRVRDEAPWALHLCDPAMGDAPRGLYVEEGSAQAIRLDLMPGADIVTPNHFELEWLTGRTVRDANETAAAAREIGAARVLATSTPLDGGGTLGNLLVSGKESRLARVNRRPHAPHGTGDLIAGLFLAHLLHDDDDRWALAMACAGVEAALDASGEADELQLTASPDSWANPQPLQLEAFIG